MGKSQRVKGHQFERDLAISLRTLDPTAKRHLEYQEGAGYDIDTKLPLTIQCKAGARPPWLKSIMEAIKVAPQGRYPVGAVKVDNVGEFAVMQWDDFLDIFGRSIK